MWPGFCGQFQPSSGKNSVPKMYLVDRYELCVCWVEEGSETVKGTASLEVSEPQEAMHMGVWT